MSNRELIVKTLEKIVSFWRVHKVPVDYSIDTRTFEGSLYEAEVTISLIVKGTRVRLVAIKYASKESYDKAIEFCFERIVLELMTAGVSYIYQNTLTMIREGTLVDSNGTYESLKSLPLTPSECFTKEQQDE